MATTPKRYLTPEEDASFDGYVKAWQRELGLMDWAIYRRATRAPGAMADISPEVYGRQAGYRTGNWTHIEPSEPELARIALHEVLHAFFAELIRAAYSEDADWVATAEHRCINTLIPLLTKETP